jgi:hypothetical protein
LLLIAGHRHHHLIGLELAIPGLHHVQPITLEQPLDARARADRQLEARRVGLEVVRHLVLGGERVGRSRELHAGQSVQLGRREQAQGIPAPAPDVADPLRRVQDREVQPEPAQVVSHRQTGWPPPITMTSKRSRRAGALSRPPRRRNASPDSMSGALAAAAFPVDVVDVVMVSPSCSQARQEGAPRLRQDRPISSGHPIG